MTELTRRHFLSHAAMTGVGLPMISAVNGLTASKAVASVPVPGETAEPKVDGVPLRWLDGQDRSAVMGVTWGVAWPRGQVKRGSDFGVFDQSGGALPSQSWALAHWPDGSVKWSGHAVPPRDQSSDVLAVRAGAAPAKPATSVSVKENADAVVIETGPLRCTIPQTGSSLIKSIEREGKPALTDAVLVALNQNQASEPTEGADPTVTYFQSRVEAVKVEQRGPVRAVVKIDGKHREVDGDRSWLPFSVRLYFYAGSDHVRVMHSFIFDGDEHKDFIRGLGLRFNVPMLDKTYNRHSRFVSAEGGLWAEAVQGITGLRRDPGEQVRRLQSERTDDRVCAETVMDVISPDVASIQVSYWELL